MRKILPLVAAASLSLSACCAAPITPSIPIPPRPILPTLTQEQDASIPGDIYEILDQREETLEAHIERLERLIRSTEKK